LGEYGDLQRDDKTARQLWSLPEEQVAMSGAKKQRGGRTISSGGLWLFAEPLISQVLSTLETPLFLDNIIFNINIF